VKSSCESICNVLFDLFFYSMKCEIVILVNVKFVREICG
jgi:hypothetical protein